MAKQVREVLVTCGKLLLAWTILLGSFALFAVPHVGRELFMGLWALILRVATSRDMTRRLKRPPEQAMPQSRDRQTVEHALQPTPHCAVFRQEEPAAGQGICGRG